MIDLLDPSIFAAGMVVGATFVVASFKMLSRYVNAR